MKIQCKDQLGNTVSLEAPATRIVSLVPSQSELLWHLGLHDRLVGITQFCIRPAEMYQTVNRVGRTKNADLEKIRLLKPDLVIGNKEENEREQIRELQKEFPVYVSDVVTFDDAFGMMRDIGKLTGTGEEAERLVRDVSRSLSAVAGIFSGQRTAYFIWNRPYMFAGGGTFIDHVLEHIGLENVVKSMPRYPVLEIDDLRNAAPQLCLLSTEPFPFSGKHAKMIRDLLPEARVLVVDGELFSWYGSRMLHLAEYVRTLQERLSGDPSGDEGFA